MNVMSLTTWIPNTQGQWYLHQRSASRGECCTNMPGSSGVGVAQSGRQARCAAGATDRREEHGEGEPGKVRARQLSKRTHHHVDGLRVTRCQAQGGCTRRARRGQR